MDSGKKFIIGMVTVTLVMLLGGVFLIAGRQKAPDKVNLVPEGSQITGAVNGNVTLVEFGDFECPSCKTYDEATKQLLKEFPDNLMLVWRNFPLGQHKNARVAAYAAEVAGMQGKFWEMHDKLFASQNEWTSSDNATEIFTGYATGIGLDKEKFVKDMGSKEVADIISRDVQQANDLGLAGTPSFFINGTSVSNPGTLDDLRKLIKTVADKTPLPSGLIKYQAQAIFKVILMGQEVDFSQSNYQSSASAQLDQNIQLSGGNGQIIHLYKRGVTLDELFKSMKISFTDKCFELDTGQKYCNSAKTTLKMYVNGQASGEYQNYAPVDGDKILIMYGVETTSEVQKQIESLSPAK